MSPAANETYKRLIRCEHDLAERSARYRFWTQVIALDLYRWFLFAFLVVIPLIAFCFENAAAIILMPFLIGIMLRLILGPTSNGGSLNLIRIKERAPLEASKYFIDARKKELPWRAIVYIEILVIGFLLYSGLYPFIIPIGITVLAITLFEGFDHFIAKPTCKNFTPKKTWNDALTPLGVINSASDKFPRIGWFDHIYRTSLSPGETIAAKALFKTSYDTPSTGIVFGWLVASTAAACISLTLLTMLRALLPVFVGAIVFGLPLATFVLTRIRGAAFHGLRSGIVRHRDVISAYFKLSVARWAIAWVPSAAGIIFLFKTLGEDAIATQALIMAAKTIIAAPGFACLGIMFRLAIPLTVKGIFLKTVYLWLAAFCCIFPLFSLPSSLSRQCNPDEGSIAIQFSLIILGSLIGGCLLLIHYLGWKRGWYDV